MASKEVTKNVTFRFSQGEDFQVQLIFESENGKLIAANSSTRFFVFLKKLNLVTPSEEADTWFKNCDGSTITSFSKPECSFIIRKKASILGLKVIPGESFQRKRAESYNKVAYQKKQAAMK